jgi:hypothetical protein
VPFIYAAAMKLAGGPNVRAAIPVLYVQSIIGGLGAWLYWLIIRRLASRSPGKLASWVSPVVAALVCFWPESLVSVTVLWYYVWQEAFIALFLFALLLWTERGTPVSAANAGLCCGALALVSVTPVPAAVILMGAAAWRSRRNRYRGAVIATASFAAVIAPWVIRNSIAFDTVVPLRSNAGFEIFQGNNPIECIREPADAPHPASDLGQYRLYEQMGEIRYSRRCLDLAGSYVQAHPLQTAYRIVARVYIVWLTDLSNHWAPSYAVPFGQRSTLYKLRYIISSVLIVFAVGSFWWGVTRGRFASLPYPGGFFVLLFFLPLPHYLTLADPEYTTTFRMLLAITSICMMGLRQSVAMVARRSDRAVSLGPLGEPAIPMQSAAEQERT